MILKFFLFSQNKKSKSLLSLFLIVFALYTKTTHRFDERLISEEDIYQINYEIEQENLILQNQSKNNATEHRTVTEKKPLTIAIYMAADNDLHYFAWKNLKQMEQIGSNENISIVVQLNTPGYANPTKRYYVKKNKRILIPDLEGPNHKLNSGNPYTLIEFMNWVVTNHPAEQYALILWNHGTGAMDPFFSKTINPCELFYFNPTSKMLEIDRSLNYISLILEEALKTDVSSDNAIFPDKKRGICFDETFKTYLTNQDLEFALHEIYTKILKGKKLGLLGFDACLMSMIEIASLAQNYAHFLVGSQEVEYGTGWRYDLVLKPFLQKPMSIYEFAKHIVVSYEQAYTSITNEYTQSALDLSLINQLELNVNQVSQLLIQALAGQINKSVLDILRKCKSIQYCTCFDEPSYIDLTHFYENLLDHLVHFHMKDKALETRIIDELRQTLSQGLKIISNVIIANKVGKKLQKARGISIYFPERSISSSYMKSSFAQTNQWGALLTKYILG